MKILVINGSNLNILGQRDPTYYGTETLADIEHRIRNRAEKLNDDLGLRRLTSEKKIEVDFFQSNHEGAIVDYIQTNALSASAIIINAGALTHYGLSLGDAIADCGLPVVEVHMSNIYAREEFRTHSVIGPIALGQIAGLGWRGYVFALDYLVEYLNIGGE